MTARLRTLSLATLLLVAVAGCGSDDDDPAPTGEGSAAAGGGGSDDLQALVEAAQEEGELLVYSSTPDVTGQPIYAAFTEAYGITVNAIPRIVDSELIARFQSEIDSGGSPADIISVASPQFYAQQLQAGTVSSIEDLDLPARAGYPDAFVGDAYVDVGTSAIGACYNTDAVSESDLTSYEDLLNPDFQLQFVDPRGFTPNMGVMLLMRDALGDDFLEDFGARDKTLSQSAVPAVQLVIAGEADVVFPCYESFSRPQAAQGAPIDFAVLGPTTGGSTYFGVLATAEHTAASRLFLNWMMTEEGQADITQVGLASPLGRDFPPGSLSLPEDFTSLDAEFAQRIAQEQDEVVDLLGLG